MVKLIRKRILLISLLLLSVFNLFATVNAMEANTILKGKVVLKGTNEPIIGAVIQTKDKAHSAVVSMEGEFEIMIDGFPVELIVTSMGYDTRYLNVSSAEFLRIEMSEKKSELDEVVFIAYGTSKKSDLTGAVASINSDKLNTNSNTTISQALQGKIAGVNIVSRGGQPGAGTKVMIRGLGTLNNSNPLYIVDGMYMDGIDHINPNDIKSIGVLKDASSAAIYGSRAANGVVIITTKSGFNSDGEPIINVSSNIGVNTPVKYLDMLNAEEWAKVTTIARKAVGKAPLEMAKDLQNKEDNDWQRIIMKPALMQNHNVSVRGGSKSVNYYTSLGFTDQEGTAKNTEYKRYTLQSKIDYTKNRLKIGANLILTYNEDKPTYVQNRGGFIGHVLQSIPTLSKYDENNLGGYGGTYGDVVNISHPLGMTDRTLIKRTNNHFNAYANLYAELELIEGLKYKLNFTPDYHFGRNGNFNGLYNFGLSQHFQDDLSETQNRRRSILAEHLLSFNKSIKDHKIEFLAGYSYRDSRYRMLTGSGQGLPHGIFELDAATTGKNAQGSSSRSVLTSIFSRIFYSYKNKYMLTATVRRDGSSKFAKNNRYAFFPSISLGWDIAQEKFMEGTQNWLDQFKIRGGYGVLGNQEIANYQYSSIVSTGINYADGNDGILLGAFSKFFANPDIKWEETSSTNIGLDLSMLDNRLSLTADWYIKNTKDILLHVPIPISTGAANDPISNAGKIRNSGFEVSLGWKDEINQDMSYSVNLVGTYNKNKVIKMGSESQAITSGKIHGGTYTTKTMKGHPISGFWLIKCDGYFNSQEEVNQHSKNGVLIQPSAQPGDIRFIDANNDGTINDEDRVFCGEPFPDFTFGINGTFNYKNFDVAMSLQGVIGNKIYNATRLQLEDVSRGTNYLTTTLNYWTPENHNADVPRLTWNDVNRNARPESDRFLEDGSYLKLRSLQLGYTLRNNLLNTSIKKIRFFISLENLFTITSYSGYSPDVNVGNVYAPSFDQFIYPSNRTYMMGLNLTF